MKECPVCKTKISDLSSIDKIDECPVCHLKGLNQFFLSLNDYEAWKKDVLDQHIKTWGKYKAKMQNHKVFALYGKVFVLLGDGNLYVFNYSCKRNSHFGEIYGKPLKVAENVVDAVANVDTDTKLDSYLLYFDLYGNLYIYNITDSSYFGEIPNKSFKIAENVTSVVTNGEKFYKYLFYLDLYGKVHFMNSRSNNENITLSLGKNFRQGSLICYDDNDNIKGEGTFYVTDIDNKIYVYKFNNHTYNCQLEKVLNELPHDLTSDVDKSKYYTPRLPSDIPHEANFKKSILMSREYIVGFLFTQDEFREAWTCIEDNGKCHIYVLRTHRARSGEFSHISSEIVGLENIADCSSFIHCNDYYQYVYATYFIDYSKRLWHCNPHNIPYNSLVKNTKYTVKDFFRPIYQF